MCDTTDMSYLEEIEEILLKRELNYIMGRSS